MHNIVIRNNNIDSYLFDNFIDFNPTDNIDNYISNEIIPQIAAENFDRIFIKDNLSSNYLELLGLRVAYHIRFSEELGDKRYCPIFILSDFDSQILNKLDPIARILFTKNIYIISNTKEDIEKYKSKNFEKLTIYEYNNKFLGHIGINPPQDYTDHHDVTNEWAIYQWSNALGVSSDTISINHKKISSMLYFKYLNALHEMNDSNENEYEIEASVKKGKILFIDDEWNKGWSNILASLFESSADITFQTFEYEYKDIQKFRLLQDIKKAVNEENPDVIILDLRLAQSDHSRKDDIDTFTGIKVLQMIHDINPGIQVIMMTATRQSIILEKLYDYGVLGYIKKEHPDDMSIHTAENISKLFRLVGIGLDRKYLKDIYITKTRILNILQNDIFARYITNREKYEPFWIQLEVEAKQVFDILSRRNSENKFKYAMVSIASSLESLLSIFIVDKRWEDNRYWDGELCNSTTLNAKLMDLFYDKFGYEIKDSYRKKLGMKKMVEKRNDYLHSRKEVEVSRDEIKSWFNKLLKMIEVIENPPKLRKYNTANMAENLNNAFGNR